MNLKDNFYVLAYYRVKIDKQCEQCTNFCAQLVNENQIYSLFPQIFA